MSELKHILDKPTLNLASKVAEERGVPTDKLLGDLEANMGRVAEKVKSPDGKYTVLGIDKFDNEDWVEIRVDTPYEALMIARNLTAMGMKNASDSSIATVYYAYSPDGRYLGGDTWSEE